MRSQQCCWSSGSVGIYGSCSLFGSTRSATTTHLLLLPFPLWYCSECGSERGRGRDLSGPKLKWEEGVGRMHLQTNLSSHGRYQTEVMLVGWHNAEESPGSPETMGWDREGLAVQGQWCVPPAVHTRRVPPRHCPPCPVLDLHPPRPMEAPLLLTGSARSLFTSSEGKSIFPVTDFLSSLQ